MMWMRSLVLLLVGMVVGSFGQSGGIAWQGSLTEALALAAQQKKPVLIAFNMDRERANDRMARDHYKDASVVAISKKFVCVMASKFRHAEEIDGVCPRFGTTTCTGHIKCEIDARKRYLKTVNVDSPQHLILKSDGTLFRKKVWFMSKEQLAELLSQAHRDLYPDQYAEPKTKTPAVKEIEEPAEVSEEEETPEESGTPETTKEIKAAILKKRDIWEIKELARQLMKKLGQAEEKEEAEKALDDLLNNKEYQAEVTCGLILAQGFKGNKPGVKKIIRFLRHEEEKVRSHTAVALEDIADPSAYGDIKKQLKREEERLVIKNLVRALGATGAKKRGAVEMVIQFTDHPSSTVERNALISLGYFKRSGKAEKELLSIAFKSGISGRGGRRGGSRGGFGSSIQKAGAALYALGELESKKARKELKERVKRERIERVVEFYEEVLDRIEGKVDTDSPEYRKKRQELAADKIRRDNDPELEERGDRGRGRGEGEGEGDKEGEEKTPNGREGRGNRSGGQPL